MNYSSYNKFLNNTFKKMIICFLQPQVSCVFQSICLYTYLEFCKNNVVGKSKNWNLRLILRIPHEKRSEL